MEKRLREVIGLLGYEELIRVKSDLNNGGDGIMILVDNKIKDEIKKHSQFCAVCAGKIDAESETRFVLTFGPAELERTISFCAVDCLEYFLNELKKINLNKGK